MNYSLNLTNIKNLKQECVKLFDYDYSEVRTLNQFNLKLKTLSEEKHNNTGDQRNARGLIFELFAEMFFKIYQDNYNVGVVNYTPVKICDDVGVDAIGLNNFGKKCVVQIKYKLNKKEKVKYEEVSKTYCAGKLFHNLSLEDNKCVYVFTNSNGVTVTCKNVFKDKINVINCDVISKYVDHNDFFWKSVDSIFYYNLTKK